MIIEKRQGENFNKAIYLKFDYDPKIINKIKTYKQRFYHPDTKEWELPEDMEETVKKDFPDEFDYIDINQPIHLKALTKDLILGELPEGFKFKEKPFEHQIEAVRYGVAHDKFLLADEMGLGKSFESLNISRTKNIKHCLIICGVNSIKWNWKKEVEKFTEHSARVLGQRTGKRSGKLKVGTTKDKIYDLENFDKIEEFYIITNIETLRSEKIVSLLCHLCESEEIGMILLDEAHICNNPESKQTQGLLALEAKYKIAMTGTPIMNKPIDLYTIFYWLGVYNGDFWDFKNRYCKMKRKEVLIKGTKKTRKYWDIVGWKNLEELQEKLNNIILRRLKKDVLDLPEKIYIDEYIEMEEDQEKLYEDWLTGVKQDVDENKTKIQNDLVKFMRLRQITGDPEILGEQIESAKLNRLKNLVDEAVANGHSVVVYTNWRKMTETICKKLSDYKISLITGKVKDIDRVKEEQKFQSGETQVLVGTMKAIAQGLTFTKGSVEIFFDEPWTKANKEQCTDRCHRIGQDRDVVIYTLITKDSVDEKVHTIVERKGNLSFNIVDGEDIQPSQEMLDYLLSED